MGLKISQKKMLILEAGVIFFLIIILLFMGIQLNKNNSQLFKMTVSQFEENNIVILEPKSEEPNSHIYFWLTGDNEIKNVSYVDGNYALYGLTGDDETLFSSIDYPNFKETSYVSPITPGEIPDKKIKDIFMFKEFIFQSGKTVGFVLDKEGNATILEGDEEK